MHMILPTAIATVPQVSIPALRSLRVAVYTTDCGETIKVPEGVEKTNTATSAAKTIRPACRR